MPKKVLDVSDAQHKSRSQNTQTHATAMTSTVNCDKFWIQHPTDIRTIESQLSLQQTHLQTSELELRWKSATNFMHAHEVVPTVITVAPTNVYTIHNYYWCIVV